MFTLLPQDPQVFLHWSWEQLKPFMDDLVSRPLTEASVNEWLKDWSDLSRLISEIGSRLYVATTLNTADPEAKKRFAAYLDDIYPPAQAAGQLLKQKLLASGFEPEGMETPLRNMRTEEELFREENLALLSEERKLGNEYDEIIGAQCVEWEGQEVTPTQLQPVYLSRERSKREQAWRLAMNRMLEDRPKLNALWARLMQVRGQIASNAGYPDYRSYRWKQMLRFDYTPEDCKQFHSAIEEVVVPAAQRIYEKHRTQLGLASLRPWDLYADPLNREPLKPYQTLTELVEKASVIFHKVDPDLGSYFDTMRRQGLLDLENRKGKDPGAYCSTYAFSRVPFVFENAVGLNDDVATLLHECGHAFHVFESAHLPYHQQLEVGMEFGEVASMAMVLLGFPYIVESEGGYYSKKDAARALIEQIESDICFWPYMAVVDGFQHWAYENHVAASNPDQCDQKWAELWQRFMLGLDWSGLDDLRITGWQRKLHIFEDAFYYVEYGMASLGAYQVWANALKDQRGAVSAYRSALALGGTVPLPKLYEAAGIQFSFGKDMLRRVIDLAEGMIDQLEKE